MRVHRYSRGTDYYSSTNPTPAELEKLRNLILKGVGMGALLSMEFKHRDGHKRRLRPKYVKMQFGKLGVKWKEAQPKSEREWREEYLKDLGDDTQ